MAEKTVLNRNDQNIAYVKKEGGKKYPHGVVLAFWTTELYKLIRMFPLYWGDERYCDVISEGLGRRLFHFHDSSIEICSTIFRGRKK